MEVLKVENYEVINGRIGEYITMARRNGDIWFLAGMTNSEEREMKIILDFLPKGDYKMVSFSDSEQTLNNAEIAIKQEDLVDKKEEVVIKMVPGGGYAAWLEPIK